MIVRIVGFIGSQMRYLETVTNLMITCPYCGSKIDIKEEKTIIWLAGLLSTDGQVEKTTEANAVGFRFYSVEHCWLELVRLRLKEIGVKTSYSPRNNENNRIIIHEPYKLCLLFEKYKTERYFNPRKWKRIKNALKLYHSPSYIPRKYIPRKNWTEKELEVIRENVQMSDEEVANKLDVTRTQVRRARLKILKVKKR